MKTFLMFVSLFLGLSTITYSTLAKASMMSSEVSIEVKCNFVLSSGFGASSKSGTTSSYERFVSPKGCYPSSAEGAHIEMVELKCPDGFRPITELQGGMIGVQPGITLYEYRLWCRG